MQNEKTINDFLNDIDKILPAEVVGKRARLNDLYNTINLLKLDIIALRRMLVQHRDPDVVIHESGAKLGETLKEKILQYERLEMYRLELENLHDDDSAINEALN